ncbi:MAG: hypothetical protein HFH59_06800 [Lachnospiraceae bacterium]|nr:hypothetical protein [Lachnospiraceae bacterium]
MTKDDEWGLAQEPDGRGTGKNVLHPCPTLECGECPLTDRHGKCVLNKGRIKAMEWLESEHEERS